MMVNSLLIRPYFLGGVAFPLDSHDNCDIGRVSKLGPPKIHWQHSKLGKRVQFGIFLHCWGKMPLIFLGE